MEHTFSKDMELCYGTSYTDKIIRSGKGITVSACLRFDDKHHGKLHRNNGDQCEKEHREQLK